MGKRPSRGEAEGRPELQERLTVYSHRSFASSVSSFTQKVSGDSTFTCGLNLTCKNHISLVFCRPDFIKSICVKLMWAGSLVLPVTDSAVVSGHVINSFLSAGPTPRLQLIHSSVHWHRVSIQSSQSFYTCSEPARTCLSPLTNMNITRLLNGSFPPDQSVLWTSLSPSAVG